MRRRVVVVDVVRVVAAAERAGALVALGRKPLAICLHLVAGEDRGQRARDPARLERVRRVDAGADLAEPVVLAGLDDRRADVLHLLPRPEQLEAGDARHAVVERAHLLACDRDLAEVEELDLGQRPAVRLRQHLERGRPLHLEAVDLPPPGRVRGRPLVAVEGDVEVARLGVVLHPVVGRGATDEVDAVLVEEEEDRVADHVAVVVHGDELLRLADLEVLERVDAERGEELDDVRPLDVEVGHVVRLVEQRRRLTPGDLLVHPIRELARDARVDVRPDLGVPGHVHGVAGRLDLCLQALVAHLAPPRLENGWDRS